MTRTGTKVFACSTAILLCAAGSAFSAEREHEAAAAPTASVATGGGSATPKSLGDYYQLMEAGMAPALNGNFGVRPPVGSEFNPAPQSNLTGACDRAPLLCGIYTKESTFDTEQGPFSRALGNYEDYELANVGANIICSPSIPNDCNQHNDTDGFCGGVALDAGDLLKGLSFNTNPRGNPMLTSGPGFQGEPDRYTLPNYFGDPNILTFPNSPTPTGCQKASPGPNVLGLHLETPFGSQSVTVTLTLASGDTMTYATPSINNQEVFVGFCCPSEIVKAVGMDPGRGYSVGFDDVKWGTNVTTCPVSFPPPTLEDLDCELQAIEAKLDAGVGGGGSSCNVCVKELEALGTNNVRNGLEAKRDSACRAKLRGQIHTAENTMCAFLGSVNNAEGNGKLTKAEADALRLCAANDGIDTSGCTK